MITYSQLAQSMFTEAGRLIGRMDLNLPPKTKDPELQSKLDALTDKYRDRLNTYAIAYKEYIDLDKIMAKKDAPIGTGSSYMKELCAIADDYNRIIVLQTAPTGYNSQKGGDYFTQFKVTSGEDRLKRFYSRFGFINSFPKQGYKKYLFGNMHRLPQNKKI